MSRTYPTAAYSSSGERFLAGGAGHPPHLPSPPKRGRGSLKAQVARTGEPVRPQRGPYTGRGARTDGLPGPCHFLCTQVAAATSVMETSTRIADSAFTSGVTADFSMPYTLI